MLGAAFLRRQRRQEHPWLDPELFRRLTFSMPLATNALSFFVLYGTQFLVAQYLQLVLGLSALEAGLWTIPCALAYLAGSALAPVAASRMRLPSFLGLSLALSAAGFGLLTQLGQGSGLPVVVAATVVFSVGLAPVYVLATELIVASAPPERSGSASGVHESAAELGGACGIAMLGSIAAAAYRQAMSTARPRALDPGRWEDARRTLGGAMATAARLPEPLAAKAAGDARHAFTVALETVEMVGSGVLAMRAVASVLVLRRGTLRPCPRPSSPTARSAGSSSPAGS